MRRVRGAQGSRTEDANQAKNWHCQSSRSSGCQSLFTQLLATTVIDNWGASSDGEYAVRSSYLQELRPGIARVLMAIVGRASNVWSWQCAAKARIISGGGFRPDNCRLIRKLASGSVRLGDWLDLATKAALGG